MTSKAICVLIVFAIVFAVGCVGPVQEEGAVFRVGGMGVDTLNPLTTYMAGAMEMILLMYDPLVRFDENLDPAPCLAESWEASEDGLVWTFNLVKNAKWHDGEPVTSGDVKFTYDLMIDYGLGYAYSSYLHGIEEISCPDDYTVVIETATVKTNMLMHQAPILPMHIWGKMSEEELQADLNHHPIGSGPFKFDSVSLANDHWRLARNDDYFGPKPHIDALIFVYFTNNESMTQSLKLGEVDALCFSEVNQFAELRSDPNVEAISAKLPGFSQIGINIYEEGGGNPLLRDVNIRYAMEYALDREKIRDMVFYGCAETGSTLMSKIGGWHYEVPAPEYRSYDLDKANAILDAAGYTQRNAEGTRLDPDGNPLEFNIMYSITAMERVKIVTFLKAGCDEIGIKINEQPVNSGVIADAIEEYAYDMFIWAWYEEPDPTSILNIFTSGEIFFNNETGFTDERYDELFYLQQETLDQNARREMIYEMQQIIYDACPFIIVSYEEEIQGIRSDRWTGYKQIPVEGAYFVNSTYYNYMNVQPVADRN